MNIQMNISKKDALASDRTKKYYKIGALGRKQNRWSGKRNLFLSNKSQKERNPDDIVDTKTVTDMSETINRDHSEECEKKNLWWSNGYWFWYWYWYVRK